MTLFLMATFHPTLLLSAAYRNKQFTFFTGFQKDFSSPTMDIISSLLKLQDPYTVDS